MKKIMSLILALALMMSLAIPAFAAETNDGTENTSINVKAQYNGGATTPDKINVNVAWGAMEFTYNVGGTQEWNANTHQYVNNTTQTWEEKENYVTVTNHSNVAVQAELSFTAEAGYDLTGSFGEKATMNLATAVGTEFAKAPADTAYLTLEGTLADTVTSLTKVGTITVKIAKQA